MWLIDEGGKALDASAYPLAQAFTLNEGNPKTDEEKEEASKNYILCAEIRKKALGIEDDSTQKAVQEAIRLAKETNKLELLPDWIKKIANDQ